MKFADVRKYVKGLLSSSFVNKTVLDKLGEDDNNNLTYNGAAIEGGGVITLPDNIVLHAEDGEVVELPTAAPINLIEVDTELSETSENPVQNKVIATKLNEIAQSTGGGNASEIYSKTEQKIGTWIDGRTLYSCTYHIESLPGANESITFGSRKYHKIISFEGFASHKEVDWFFPLPYINASNEKIIIDSVTDGDENKCIRITATTDRSDVEAWVTVKYTAVERDTDGKPELEFSTAGEAIVTAYSRTYYKTTNDFAIGGYAKMGDWYGPWLISKVPEGTQYYSSNGSNYTPPLSFEYEGETWYYSTGHSAYSNVDLSQVTGRALYLNDIEFIADKLVNNDINMKAILDYYFYG